MSNKKLLRFCREVLDIHASTLQWIREMSQKEECLESLANHDMNVIPHEIVL